MVEEYLEGRQFSTESLFYQGRASTPGFTDRNYTRLAQFEAFMVEDGGQMPTALGRPEKDAVSKVAEQAARTLGIETGVAKGDMVLTRDGPKVIEIASRLSGGWFSSHQIPLATGVDFLGAAIGLALGESVRSEDLLPRYRKGTAIRYFFPEPGRVVAIRNRQEFEQVSWIPLMSLELEPGDQISRATDHTRRAGFVLTTGETRQEAVDRAESVTQTMQIETIRDESSHDAA